MVYQHSVAATPNSICLSIAFCIELWQQITFYRNVITTYFQRSLQTSNWLVPCAKKSLYFDKSCWRCIHPRSPFSTMFFFFFLQFWHCYLHFRLNAFFSRDNQFKRVYDVNCDVASSFPLSVGRDSKLAALLNAFLLKPLIILQFPRRFEKEISLKQ